MELLYVRLDPSKKTFEHNFDRLIRAACHSYHSTISVKALTTIESHQQ